MSQVARETDARHPSMAGAFNPCATAGVWDERLSLAAHV